jgi:hypothetical protein
LGWIGLALLKAKKFKFEAGTYYKILTKILGEMSDNYLGKFDNLGLRGDIQAVGEPPQHDFQEEFDNKNNTDRRNGEKKEITIRDFNIFTTLGIGPIFSPHPKLTIPNRNRYLWKGPASAPQIRQNKHCLCFENAQKN